ncbi:MAG: hypothetical protein KTR33_00945, partial [Gammaproteobacteria bacterium]|nr:hypothetical protein [Gammaproteobacteria bacterium]
MSLNTIHLQIYPDSAARIDSWRNNNFDMQARQPQGSPLYGATQLEQSLANIESALPGFPSQSGLESLLQQADELRNAPPNETFIERLVRLSKLAKLERQIEQQVIEILERHAASGDTD